MNLENFKKRTSELQIPKRIYDKYGEIVKACESCQKFHPAPERSRITGMRAVNFGDLWFLDHVEVNINEFTYQVLVISDAASNFLWADAQKTKEHEETIEFIMSSALKQS